MATDNNEKKKKTTSPAAKSTTAKKTVTKKSTGTKKKTASTKASSTKTTKPAAKTTKNASTKNKMSTTTAKKTTTKTGHKTTVPKKKDIKPVEIDLTEEVDNGISNEVVSELHITEHNLETETVEREDTNKKESVYEITSILGAKLPTGQSAEDKKVRKKHYLKDSIVFAIVIPLIDLLAMFFFEPYKPFNITDVEWLNYGINLIFDFIVIFFITYVIDYALSEDDVKKNANK